MQTEKHIKDLNDAPHGDSSDKVFYAVLALIRQRSKDGHPIAQEVRRIAKWKVTHSLRKTKESDKALWTTRVNELFDRLEKSKDSWEQRNLVEILHDQLSVGVENRLKETMSRLPLHHMVREKMMHMFYPNAHKYGHTHETVFEAGTGLEEMGVEASEGPSL